MRRRYKNTCPKSRKTGVNFMTKKESYLWQFRNGDVMHGPFDNIDKALADAKLEARGLDTKIALVWRCRPARQSDRRLFHGSECSDCNIKGWAEGRIVPADIVHKFIVGGTGPVRVKGSRRRKRQKRIMLLAYDTDAKMFHRLKLVAAKAQLHEKVEIDEADLRRLLVFANDAIWPKK
jgi:hypothetical protein